MVRMVSEDYPYGYHYRYNYGLTFVGWGIWTGLMFCVSGGIGLVGANRPSKAT